MLSFVLIGLVLLLAAMIPGPDFVVVTKNATLQSRRAGLWTAIGVGTAVLIHATYALAGLGYVIRHSVFLFSAIKWLGALYLAYLGIALLLSRKSNSAREIVVGAPVNSMPPIHAFLEGFFTNLLNPKAILFFVGIFSQIASLDATFTAKAALVLEAGLVVSAWFLTLVMILNAPLFKKAMLRAERPLQKVMGVALLGFAVRLAVQRLG